MHPHAFNLLLIHGAGGGGWEWGLWQGVLQAHGHRVHAPDLRPAPSGVVDTRYPDYLLQVRGALAALPQPRVLIGASLGGLLALEAAGDADALVLVNPLPPAPWHAGLPARTWPDRVDWARSARLASTRKAMPDADAASALWALRGWRDESGAVLRAASAGRSIPRPAVPMLCVASRHDADVPPAITRALADAWGADFAWSEADSHVGPLLGGHATATARQVHAWLARHGSAPPGAATDA